MKTITQGTEAREKLLKGVNLVSDIVKETLGPCGSNVVLRKQYFAPQIINDGVSIAKEISSSDPTIQAGVELITNAASNTNAAVGDGTTTTCILTQSMIEQGFKAVKEGCNPILLREEIKKWEKEIISCIDECSEEVSTSEQLEQIATISIGGDNEAGKMVAAALEKVGVDGAVQLENSVDTDTHLKIVEGYKIERGYMSPYFVNDTEKWQAAYDECLVLCVHKRIANVGQIKPLLEFAAKTQKPILLVVDEIDDNAFAVAQLNAMKKVVNICIVRSPGFGFNVRSYMDDIAKLTGGIVIDDDTKHLEDVAPEDFGVSKKMISTREYTTIVADQEETSSEELQAYVETLKNQMTTIENEHMKDSLQERISKLTAGVATISVGALSEAEQEEKKLRYEDAINATRSAMKGGIVAGGGSLLSYISYISDQIIKKQGEYSSTESAAALYIFVESLVKPEKQIILNSGMNPEEEWKYKQKFQQPAHYGFNGRSRCWQDLKEAGVIDPTLVVKSAVQNAVSIASTVLTTNATVVYEDEK